VQQGPFAPRALPRFVATTGLAAAVSPSTAFPVAPVIRSTLLHPFLGGTRTVSPVAQHALVTVLPPTTPPKGHSATVNLRYALLPSPDQRGLGLRILSYPGHFWVHSRYGPVTRSPSPGWFCRLASSASFPPRRQPELRGSDFYPGGTHLPLNMPAFAGRTMARRIKYCLSGGRPVAVVQHSAQSFLPLDRAPVSYMARLWADGSIRQSLMVTFGLIVDDEILNRCPQ
jgi:hypothetical protein